MSGASMHDLAARLARGDEAAFAELYDACAGRLHGYLSARLGSRDAASDVLQSVFLRAVRSQRRFRRVENPIAYMFQIARNEAARAVGQRRIKLQALPDDGLVAAAAENPDDVEAVGAALARLTVDDRELVELKIYAGLTFREIADVTGLPQGTVATRYRRAIESLRPWLAKQMR